MQIRQLIDQLRAFGVIGRYEQLPFSDEYFLIGTGEQLALRLCGGLAWL